MRQDAGEDGAGAGGSPPPQEEPLYVADIGSGSGCIGLTIALERPNVRLFAVDRADEALAATKANVAKHGLEKRAAVLRGDLLAAIPANRVLDWVVSNPPYIPARDIDGLEAEVRDHEPRGALDGGADGLDVYRRLIPAAAERARRGVIVEVGIGQAGAVAEWMTQAGLPDVRIWKDLAGTERVVGGRR
ncbi:MAG: N5-glutamine methyltransferase family protein [Myxococcota bacterium]